MLLFLSLVTLSMSAEIITVDYSYQDADDRAVLLFNGDTLKVKFNERPSTGFIWQMFNEISNSEESILVMDESSYLPANSKSIGAQGLKLFTFQAVNSGTQDYTFVNGRPWEVDSFIQENGLFDGNAARDNGIVFTMITLTITVDESQTRFNMI